MKLVQWYLRPSYRITAKVTINFDYPNNIDKFDEVSRPSLPDLNREQV